MKDTTQRPVSENGRAIRFFYGSTFGRFCLWFVRRRIFSKVVGLYLSSPFSKRMIPGFIKKNRIDMQDYEPVKYRSFNQFFSRKIKEGARPADPDEDVLLSPCDAYVQAYPITDGLVLPIKQSHYSIASLLKDPELAKCYRDGICLVFRLTVKHYHRYSYPCTGKQSACRFLRGTLHTIRPIALEQTPVYVQNCREYCTIESEKFGTVTQMEIGALLVGKIKNHYRKPRNVTRGEEKGMFRFGGSSIVLLLEKDRVKLDPTLFPPTLPPTEIPVFMNESLGRG